MRLDDLYPFVVPHVPQMPLPTVDHHLKVAANEFFSKTLGWQASLDPFVSLPSKSDYELDVPTGAEIVRVFEVVCDEMDYAKECRLLQAEGPVLRFLELPPVGKTVALSVALAPSVGAPMASWAIPDGLSQYRKDIAHGALSSLKALKGDMGESDRFMAMFSARIASVAALVARSRTGARIGRRESRQSVAQFF